jgi:hypothetical protein
MVAETVTVSRSREGTRKSRDDFPGVRGLSACENHVAGDRAGAYESPHTLNRCCSFFQLRPEGDDDY